MVKCRWPRIPCWPDGHRKCRDYWPPATGRPRSNRSWISAMTRTSGRATPARASGSCPAFGPSAAAYGRRNAGSVALGTGRRPAGCAATTATACWSTATSQTSNFVSRADSFDPSEMSLKVKEDIVLVFIS